MKATLNIEANTEDKLKLLIRVAEEMGMAVSRSSIMDFSTLALPGPSLSPSAQEELAGEMEADVDFVNEEEVPAYLSQLKAAWKKPKA